MQEYSITGFESKATWRSWWGRKITGLAWWSVFSLAVAGVVLVSQGQLNIWPWVNQHTSSSPWFARVAGATSSLVQNSDFATGTTAWVFYTDGAGTLGVTAAETGNPFARVAVTAFGTNVQLYQTGIKLDPKTRYHLSFRAYSNTGHDVAVALQQHGSPYTNYGLAETSVALGTSWADYSMELTTPDFGRSVDDARLRFWLAPYAKTGDEYFFDDVIFEPALSASDSSLASVIDLSDPAAYGSHVQGVVTLTVPTQGTVVAAQFFLDGKALAPEITKAPFTFIWDTIGVVPGTHQVQAKLRVASGQVATLAQMGVVVGPQGVKPAVLGITQQPASQTVVTSTRATFSVIATGSEPLTYQWQWSNSAAVDQIVHFVNIPGAQSANYTTGPLDASYTGAQYRVIVTNPTGSITSEPASVKVIAQGVKLPPIKIMPIDAMLPLPVVIAPVNPEPVIGTLNGLLVNPSGTTEIWYVDPISGARSQADNAGLLPELVKKYVLGITDSDLARLAIGLVSEAKLVDTDVDGLPDVVESAIGSDPNNSDSDGDSCNDSIEVLNNYDPLGPGKHESDLALAQKLNGRLLLQVEGKGEVWYVNPADSKRYLVSGDENLSIIQALVRIVSLESILKVPVGP